LTKRDVKATVAALALLANGITPWACEPSGVVNRLTGSSGSAGNREPEPRVAATQLLQRGTTAVAGRKPLHREEGDASELLLPRYDACGEIELWIPEEVRDDIDNRVIHYHGEWQRDSDVAGSFGGTVHNSKQPGATATFVVPAKADYGWLAIGFTKAPNLGLAKVYFDEKYVETINLYSPVVQYQCERGYYLGEHADAEHRLQVRAEGKSGGASDTYIIIDYFAAGW
jgi:hypothetical protein